MVLTSPLGEWVLTIVLLVLVIGFVCFVGLGVLGYGFGFDSLIPTITISFFLGLYILGKIIGNKVVIYKQTKSIVMERRHFLLIHTQRVIPFSAVKDVDFEYKSGYWRVSLVFGGPEVASKKVEKVNIADKAAMKPLVNELKNFNRRVPTLDAASEKCANHPNTDAVDICIRCGRYLCDECAVLSDEDKKEEVYCISCVDKLFPHV